MTAHFVDKLVAVIPARGGSKRIPNKNIAPLLGKPLLAYTIQAAQEAQVVERVIVSTDSEQIADVARQYGAEVIHRPPELAHETASTESALIHVIETLAGQDKHPEWILTLPPTSPLRTSQTIANFIAAYIALADRFDAMI